MGGTTSTTSNTSTSAPTNPDVQATASKLAQKLSGLADQSPAAFGQSIYSPVGATTQNAWTQGTNSANGLISSGGLTAGQTGAVNGLKGLTGAYDQNSPGYQTLRQNAMDEAIKNVGAGFVNSGRFGGGSYTDQATKSAVNAIAPLDYQNYQNNIENQKGIYNTLFGYGQTGLGNQQAALAQLGAIGGAQDANQQGILQGNYDLYTRQQNAPIDWLSRITSASAGNAAGTGTTTTNTSTQPTTPWWQSALGLGLQAL